MKNCNDLNLGEVCTLQNLPPFISKILDFIY